MKFNRNLSSQSRIYSRDNNKNIHSLKRNEWFCTNNEKSMKGNDYYFVYNPLMEKPFINSLSVRMNRDRNNMTDLDNNKRIIDSSWDFTGENAKISIHGIHTYPAMMIPQIAKRLIEEYGNEAKTILDPFCGSGTSLVESLLHNKNSYGNDINPLAILISKVKTTPINPIEINKIEQKLIQKLRWETKDKGKVNIPDYQNIDYWFKPNVIKELAYIKELLHSIEDKDIRDFFLVCFSETVRSVSNTRGGEYKLYRIPKEKLAIWNPDTFSTFLTTVHENISLMNQFFSSLTIDKIQKGKLWTKILYEDMREKTSIPKDSIDFIVTSPPYGDSRTTVAYGQFSRLALQWLDYDYNVIKEIDRICLGGIRPKKIKEDLPSTVLYEILEKISAKDGKRVLDVYSFYLDFDKTVNEINRVTKEDARICMVVGNRTVKREVIPTDVIFAQLFEAREFNHIKTIIRKIPTKRLPKKTSPSNIKGQAVSTMNEEYIIILQK